VRSITSQPFQHQARHRQVDHCLATLGQVLVIFAHPPVPPDPGEGPFHRPTARQHTEGRHRRGLDIRRVPPPLTRALDDLQPQPALLLDPLLERCAAVAHVGPDQLQPRAEGAGRAEDEERPDLVLDIGGVGDPAQQETRRLNEDVALAPADLLPPVVAVGAPFSVVLTDCESMTAAEGWASRPISWRSLSWR